MKPITVRRWEVVAAFVALTVAFVVMGVYLKNDSNSTARVSRQSAALAISNRDAIAQLKRQNAELQRQKKAIQAARVRSCKKTYGAFIEVFRPFLAPARVRTAAMKADVAQFRATVRRLQAHCAEQTGVRKTTK